MGGRVSALPMPSIPLGDEHFKGCGNDAVILKNDYAVQEELGQPVYVMGYVNDLAVENYQKTEGNKLLGCEKLLPEDLFTGAVLQNCYTDKPYSPQSHPVQPHSAVYPSLPRVRNTKHTDKLKNLHIGVKDKSVVFRNSVIIQQYKDLAKNPVSDTEILHKELLKNKTENVITVDLHEDTERKPA